MKKIFIALLLSAVSLGASAQFEKGTKYAGASLSGLGLSYSKAEDFRLGLQAVGGFFVADSWMVLGQFGWEHLPGNNSVNLGVAGRLYFTPEVGYCFYLNDHVSIEPAVYVDMCLNHFKDFTKVGLRIGFGYYF